jgi:serine/threonine protein kinase
VWAPLCSQGELFDLLCNGGEPPPIDATFRFALQLAAAVEHCHHCGAVHGQLLPHNLLLRRSSADGNLSLQLIGFACCLPPQSGADGSLRDARAPSVELRPSHKIDAPELRGRQWAEPHELLAADAW